MILITLRHEDSRTIVGIAGRLGEENLAELRKQCAAAAQPEAQTKLIFDLSELKSADKKATHWLGKRYARGDVILGASPYIKLLIERDQQRSDSLITKGSHGASEGDK